MLRRFYTEKDLIRFQAGIGPDQNGWLITEIIRADDVFWENRHDYIQWVFPIREKSCFNWSAPTVSDPGQYETPYMKAAYTRFQAFLQASQDWKRKGNHNQRRISRCLKSLDLFGYTAEAEEFRTWLLYEILSSHRTETADLCCIYSSYWERKENAP